MTVLANQACSGLTIRTFQRIIRNYFFANRTFHYQNPRLIERFFNLFHQFKQSFWYVVTGGCENYDLNKEETVKREVKEETNLLTNNNIYLNWILEYESLGVQCKEYVYISFVNK